MFIFPNFTIFAINGVGKEELNSKFLFYAKL